MTAVEPLTLFEVGAGTAGSPDGGAHDAVPTSGTARTTDPATSHAAAESIAPALHVEQRRVLAIIERRGGLGATAGEVTAVLRAEGYQRERGSIARRITDLRHGGYVVDSGEIRRADRPGARAEIVWTVA